MYQMSQGYMPARSGLEYMANSPIRYSVSAPAVYNVDVRPAAGLAPSLDSSFARTYSQQANVYNFLQTREEYNFMPEEFLKPGQGGKFVGDAEEVRGFVEETFQLIFDQPFPTDIKLSLLDEKKFRKLAPNSSTIGLSINRPGLLSEIFVLNGSLAKVLLTIGHELGHILTPTLDNAHDEEAKAYAFSLAWIKTIQENNIAGLGNALITELPAENGLHDIAYDFVSKLIREGKNVWDLYLELIKRTVSITALS